LKRGLRFCVYATIVILFSCNSQEGKSRLRVATAANLRFAMEEVNNAFEMQTGIRVEMITASSGKLTAQIKSGAPYDVFLSANYKYPQALYSEGFTTGKPVHFCSGSLVLWTNKDIPLDTTLKNFTASSIEKIGIANPQNAPYGIVAIELLKRLQMYDTIKLKLIYGENVSQLNQYVLNKAVSVGITAKSAVMAPKLKKVGKWKALPLNSYSPVKQFVVIIKKSKTKGGGLSLKYIEFLSSLKAKNILENHGYSID